MVDDILTARRAAMSAGIRDIREDGRAYNVQLPAAFWAGNFMTCRRVPKRVFSQGGIALTSFSDTPIRFNEVPCDRGLNWLPMRSHALGVPSVKFTLSRALRAAKM